MRKAIISSKEITCIRAREMEIKATKELSYACTSQSKLKVTVYVELYTLQSKLRQSVWKSCCYSDRVRSDF